MVRQIIFFILYLNCALAQKAVVIVFKAPLFQEPDQNSQIIQHIKRNKIIQIKNDSPIEEFYQTVDRRGSAAYVLPSHIRLITNDEREREFKQQEDLTDYRLNQILSPSYPFRRKEKYRGSIHFDLFSQENQSYPYTQAQIPEKFSSGKRFRVQFMKEPRRGLSEEESKLYLGGFLQIYYSYNQVAFPDGQESLESDLRYSLGPMISYNLLQKNHHRFVFLSGIGLNIIDLYQVGIEGVDYLYQGFGLTSILSFQYHKKNVFKNFDLIIAPTSTILFPYNLTTDNEELKSKLLRENDRFRKNFDIDWSLSLGIQYSL